MRRLWSVWAMAGFGGFFVLESYALHKKLADDTLSAVTRDVLGLYPHRGYARLSQPVFALALVGWVAWFVPHIFRIPLENS